MRCGSGHGERGECGKPDALTGQPLKRAAGRTGKASVTICFYSAFSVLCVAGPAAAQKPDAPFPTRPVRLLVTQAAGGPTDVVARIYAARLSELMGQQAVVDNRHSAGGSIAGELTARAPADGYTLMVAANGTLAVAPHLMKLTYDARKDLAPVALIGNSPLGLLVHPPFPAASVKELVALAKARPGKINFGSSGPGATSHLAGELFKMLAGVSLVHVPYKGAGGALVGVMSGEIEMLITGLSSGIPYVKQKQLRMLGVSSVKRAAMIPDVPAIAETLPGYEFTTWQGLLAPKNTPRAIVTSLSERIKKSLAAPEHIKRFNDSGLDIVASTPDEFAVHLKKEIEKWGKVIKERGMKVE